MRYLSVFLFAISLTQVTNAQAPVPKITPPKQFFGFNIGDDYCLANYQQLKGYLETIEAQSDRMKLVTIGKTEEGRPQLMAIITSPANHKKLEQYKNTARKLALAQGVTAEDAKKLAADGKAVVWLDGGLHASETLCAQVLIETVYQLLAAQDAETKRILDDVVILYAHANPDGHDLVADWYMKEKEPTKRTLAGLPRLYQKYIGHDNNRDFYANTQAESKNMNRVLYREWFPQILYNHHQSGPPGTVMFCPPFRDPFNYFCDPLVFNGIDAVGAAMMQRFLVEGKPGVTVRSGAPYSTWFNGGLRTTGSFHNVIGILTETIGSPTPSRIPLLTAKQLPKGDYFAPISPQVWKFRSSVDYSVTANKAILDYASRHREQVLFNIWRMGQNAIEKGNRDSWTITPKVVAAAQAVKPKGVGGVEFDSHFRKPQNRDPRGFIIPKDQPDFSTATKFVNALLATGVQVHEATADFTVENKKYSKGSFIIKCSQAYRAHVLDMFEPQDHPNDFAYPGGPPVKPYDSAGYTLAFQMGIRFDRVLNGFDAPAEEIGQEAIWRHGIVSEKKDAVGFYLDPRANEAFSVVNKAIKAGGEVRRLTSATEQHPAGTFFISAKSPMTAATFEKYATLSGVSLVGSTKAPIAPTVKPVRIGLWDRYGGSMPSGWTRWIFERFDFPYQLVFVPELDAGKLRDKFDVILLVDGAYRKQTIPGETPMEEPKETPIPTGTDPYRHQKGSITQNKTVPQLKKFVEDGGTLLTIGSSTRIAAELGLPVANHLLDIDDKPLASEKYYVPSSVLRVKVDTTHPLAWGIGEQVDVMFGNSPTFRLTSGASEKGVRSVSHFDSKAPLRSGWAWGQAYLEGGHAIIEAKLGQGRVVLFGPEVLFRGQSHGTFKFVFNAILNHGLKDDSIDAKREHLSPYGIPTPVLLVRGEPPADFENPDKLAVVNVVSGAAPDGFQFLMAADDQPTHGKVGLHVPTDAILKMQKRTLSNVGKGTITIRLAKSAKREAKSIEISGNEKADYNELRRVAMERAVGNPYPPAKPQPPIVPKGTLVIVGGGGMTPDIAKRFLDAGGGEDGRFVVLPISMPDPIRTQAEESFIRKMGAKNVTVIPYREQKDLEDPKVIDTFKKATGIWFGGGRQWNFVDAYEGTKLPALFREVLNRGGVIGGSSAGATIQGDFMVRGAPAGPHIMMCEGYEQALGFLPGVAIDQHFSARNRFKDMTAFMKVYPQFLGIGIDEATALVVQGSTAEILGKGKVHFYDNTKKLMEGEPDYDAFPAGTKYDLVKRRCVETPK